MKSQSSQNLIKKAREIVQKLQKSGFEAYFAGGSVRDMLLGKKPKDIDIATAAKPEQIEKVFKKTIPVGKQFGVIVVVEDGHNFEVATFRKEGEYEDYRRPSKVIYTSAQVDAQRRDFTINGIFYDPIKKKVIDFVSGQKDIKSKIIRFIGQAQERIGEDNLRILRALRLKNILGFKYVADLERILQKNVKLLKNVSSERIRDEFNLMLQDTSRSDSLKDLDKLGILKLLLPEIEKMKGVEQPPQFHSEGDVFVHTILAVKSLPQNKLDPILVWAVLLHDVGKPLTSKVRSFPQGERVTFYEHTKIGGEIAAKIANRFRFSKDEREKVVFLVKNHLISRDIMRMKEAKQIRWALHPWFSDLLLVFKTDSNASLPHDYTLYYYAKQLYDRESSKPQPPKPFISGHDLIKEFNMNPGPKIGVILEKVYDAQLEGKIKNIKEALNLVKSTLDK